MPHRITHRLAVDLQDANGWDALKGLPCNRRTRKRLHQSPGWVLVLGSNPVDPLLRQMCQARGLELLVFGSHTGETLKPEVWKALSWGAYTGRVVGVVCEAPMHTWSSIQVSETATVQARTVDHPWGLPNNATSVQALQLGPGGVCG